jgi:jumonji domain-containing protein 7
LLLQAFSPLLQGKPYLWLGDGETVGKMHFDPYDNLLIQYEGSKSFRIIDPSENERFYEGHMREAQLETIPNNEAFSFSDYSFRTPMNKSDLFSEKNVSHLRKYSFIKRKLMESTSMVHSPVDIDNIDLNRYPLSKSIPDSVMKCDVSAGDAIYLPSYFWHEVTFRLINISLHYIYVSRY